MNTYKQEYNAKTIPLDEFNNFIKKLPREGSANWCEIQHVVVHGNLVTIVWTHSYYTE